MRGYKGGGKAGRVTEGGAWAVRGIGGGGGRNAEGIGVPGPGSGRCGTLIPRPNRSLLYVNGWM